MSTVYLDRKSAVRCVGSIHTHDMQKMAEDCCRVACRVGGMITVEVRDDGNVMVHPTGTVDEQALWMDHDNIVGVFDLPPDARGVTKHKHSLIIREALCAHVESIA